MSGEVIQFPGGRKKREVTEEVVHAPTQLFHIDENGLVDMADGISVTDAVTTFWLAVSQTVREAWEDGPLARERARTRLLTAYLDRHHPGWREDIVWTL